MKTLYSFIACLFLLALASTSTFAQNSDAIIGKWLNEEKDGTVEIYKQGNQYFGKIIWMERGADTIDEKNPDANLKNRKLMGTNILQDFVFDVGDKQWQDGTIYDPKKGKTYSCLMWFNDNGSLSIRGYIGFSMLGRTTVWTRPPAEHVSNN